MHHSAFSLVEIYFGQSDEEEVELAEFKVQRLTVNPVQPLCVHGAEPDAAV
jgi:hypothetical protein